MHHNSNNQEGEKIPPKHQAEKIATFLAQWGVEVVQQGWTPPQFKHLLETLKRTYLEHDWADDGEERREVLLLFEKIENLFDHLSTWSQGDMDETEELILKLTA